jgi:hypothetical protein
MWPRGQTFAFGQQFGKIIYKGRLAEMSACDRLLLTLLEWKLLSAPDEKIVRLEREYRFHPIRKHLPPHSE